MMTELIEQRTDEVLAARGGQSNIALSDDLLTRMIEASFGEDKRLSKQELIDITMQVIAAGHETTASALTWITYALATHQDVQNRLREELSGIEVTNSAAKAIDDLPYLNNVIREALRGVFPDTDGSLGSRRRHGHSRRRDSQGNNDPDSSCHGPAESQHLG
ncbi:hypothetical protein FSOLCH5_014356 [Fusarium solani]